MATKVSSKPVSVPQGYLAYLGSDETVWASPRRGVDGTKKHLGTEKISRKSGNMYWVGGDGYVYSKQR